MVATEQRDGQRFPQLPGAYALICYLESTVDIGVGRLGTFSFEPGFYIYFGSALGSGGLAGRLERHLKQDRPVNHWHIDYLTDIATVEQVWYCQHENRREHKWAAHLSRKQDVRIPIPRFGASDCRCPAHLFYSEDLVVPAIFDEPLITVDLK